MGELRRVGGVRRARRRIGGACGLRRVRGVRGIDFVMMVVVVVVVARMGELLAHCEWVVLDTPDGRRHWLRKLLPRLPWKGKVQVLDAGALRHLLNRIAN